MHLPFQGAADCLDDGVLAVCVNGVLPEMLMMILFRLTFFIMLRLRNFGSLVSLDSVSLPPSCSSSSALPFLMRALNITIRNVLLLLPHSRMGSGTKQAASFFSSQELPFFLHARLDMGPSADQFLSMEHIAGREDDITAGPSDGSFDLQLVRGLASSKELSVKAYGGGAHGRYLKYADGCSEVYERGECAAVSGALYVDIFVRDAIQVDYLVRVSLVQVGETQVLDELLAEAALKCGVLNELVE